MKYSTALKFLLAGLVSMGSLTLCGQNAARHSLHGTWQFSLDSLNVGETEGWYQHDLPYSIHLPGSVDEGSFGKKHVNGTPLYDGRPETYRLARRFTYIGPAWYRKEVYISPDWKDKQVFMDLERCMWQTKVWVNTTYAGENHSLCAPHRYELTRFLKPGKNMISIRIDNSPQVNLGSWSHGYSPEIQTIWNGIIGKMDLYAVSPVHVKDIQVYPSFSEQRLTVKLHLHDPSGNGISGNLKFSIRDKDLAILSHKEKLRNFDSSEPLVVTIPLKGKLKPWDECTPQLYTLRLEASLGKQEPEHKELVFGLRDLKSEGGRFVLNGTRIMLRGEHDAGSFPLTGYPSMDKKEWIRIYTIAKQYGFNHFRFHSWCPPKAAFEAADEMGIILQPELTLFSQTWEHTLIGEDEARDAFLKSELKQLLDTYGNHPSFGLMCMGNELKGDPSVLEEWVAWGKQYDPRHLYAGSANLEAMKRYEPLKGDEYMVAHSGQVDGKHVSRRMGNFNTEKPNTVKDYAHTLVAPYTAWPIISHEAGQWAVYPDFREIEKFKGVLLPRNLEVFRSKLEEKGMLDQAADFVQASGKLSVLLYREEIERLLRTPNMGGFQILDLHDFPGQGSALVGILNQFWETKGLTTPEEFRQSCNDVTLLLKMPKRTWLNSERFTAELVVPNYTSAALSDFTVNWKIVQGIKVLKEGILSRNRLNQGDVHAIGTLAFDLSAVEDASRLTVVLEEASRKVSNAYDIWVYPARENSAVPEGVILATQVDGTLLQQLQRGASVLLVTDQLPDTEKMTFTTPFWSTIMFNYQVKTMGILCNPAHPVFSDFPTDFHTNWQWWELVHDARALRLNKTAASYRPVLQVIDHAVRNDKLGAIVETKIGKGKLILCTLDILSDPGERYVARQLKESILRYMATSEFDPPENKELTGLIFPEDAYAENPVVSAKSSPEDSANPAAFAFDNDLYSYWKIETKNAVTCCKVEFNEPRFITGCSVELRDSSIRPASFSVYVTDHPENPGEAVITGHLPQEKSFEALKWDNGFTIQKGKKGKFALIEIKSQKQTKQTIDINQINWIFGD